MSLILGFDARIWGAWFLLLLALVLWYKPYLGEGLFVVALNVVDGHRRSAAVGAHADVPPESPAGVPRSVGRPARQRLSRDSVADRDRLGRLVRHAAISHGPQKRLAFLPEQHTDFIFAVVGEELGFIGVTIALALFLFLFLRVIRIAERANDSFSSLVAFGLLASWFSHVLENVGMTLNVMPITGIPLPFFSYGGSLHARLLAGDRHPGADLERGPRWSGGAVESLGTRKSLTAEDAETQRNAEEERFRSLD